MPLLRYFLFVGGTLLALLMILDAWLPKQPMPTGPMADLSTIRVHSDRKWPERLVFDTSMPALAQTHTAQAGSLPLGLPPAASEQTSRASGPSGAARWAFAQAPAAASKQMASAAKPEAKLRPGRRVARRNRAPAMVIVAQHPPFGFLW